MSEVPFNPTSAFCHLSSLADQFSTCSGPVELKSVAKVESAFAPPQSSLAHVFRSIFSSPTPVTIVNADDRSQTVTVLPYDKTSNIQAIRLLFQGALQWEETHSSESDETQMGKIINFVLHEDSEETAVASGQILQKHALQRLHTDSLESLETVCSQASTVIAISMDVTHFLLTKEPPILLSKVCQRLNDLCTPNDPSSAALVASILRKVFDVAFVAIVLQARTSPSLSDEERLQLPYVLSNKIYSFFTENLTALPSWASRVMEFQERASLIKAGVALDTPELANAVQQLLEYTNNCQGPEEQTSAIAALKDMRLFLQNTATRTSSLERSAKLEDLVQRTEAQMKALRTIGVTPPSKETRWKVAKKILFDESSPLHAVLKRAFSGALSGALVGLIGSGVPGMVMGAIAGGTTDAATSAVAESIDPVVDHLPVSNRRKRSIRQICRAVALPLLGLIISICTARFLTRYVSTRRAAHIAQRVQSLEQKTPGGSPEAIHKHYNELEKAYRAVSGSQTIHQIQLQASPDAASLIHTTIPDAHVILGNSQWSAESFLTVELEKSQIARLKELQTLNPNGFKILNSQEIPRFTSSLTEMFQAPSALSFP